MTLNELLGNHRRAQVNAMNAGSRDGRDTYFDLVAYYAKRIREARDSGASRPWSARGEKRT
jgi:hypothetical protein